MAKNAPKAVAEHTADTPPAEQSAEAVVEQAPAEQVAEQQAEQAADAIAHEAEQGTVTASAPAENIKVCGVVLYAFCDQVKVGTIVKTDPNSLAVLASSGDVDLHPDAIAAAESAGANVVEL